MGITAKQRATYRLTGTTTLAPSEIFRLTKDLGAEVKGGGKSLVTTGLWNLGAHVEVVSEASDSQQLEIRSLKKKYTVAKFRARANVSDGKTSITVGGLDWYQTHQQKLLLFIPIGPKMIEGMDPYHRFIDALGSAIRSQDPSAQITIGQAG